MFNFQGGADRHEFHHSHEHASKGSCGCYGSFTMFWDWICNTDAQYKVYRASKDNRIAKRKAASACSSTSSADPASDETNKKTD